jgi:hypothetical protein
MQKENAKGKCKRKMQKENAKGKCKRKMQKENAKGLPFLPQGQNGPAPLGKGFSPSLNRETAVSMSCRLMPALLQSLRFVAVFRGFFLSQPGEEFFVFSSVGQVFIIGPVEEPCTAGRALPELELPAAQGLKILHYDKFFGCLRQKGIVFRPAEFTVGVLAVRQA